MENRLAYIQKQNNNFLTVNQYLSYYGFTRMGYDVRTFEIGDLDIFEIDKNMIFHGGVNTLHKVFNRLNIPIPEIHNPNEHLFQYCGDRHMCKMTLGEIKGMYTNDIHPFFMKPAEEQKLFTGFVVRSEIDLIKVAHLPSETKILYSDEIKMISEYRSYIYKSELVDIRKYTGSFEAVPDFNNIRNAIKDYKDQPIAYSLDFGITDDPSLPRDILIEINDMYGLGNYGLNPILYCKMIRDRWDEICQNK